jgi:hypothetical protein
MTTLRFKHPLRSACRNFSDTDAQSVWERMRAGDDHAREQFAEGYIALTMALAEQYANIYGEWYFDDFVSEALLALVAAANELVHDEPDARWGLRGYVVRAVLKGLDEAVETKNIVRIPNTSSWRLRKTGHHVPGFVSGEKGECQLRKLLSPEHTGLTENELAELLSVLPRNEIERAVLGMRQEGMTDQQVADALGVPRRAVLVIRQDLYSRFVALVNGERSDA